MGRSHSAKTSVATLCQRTGKEGSAETERVPGRSQGKEPTKMSAWEIVRILSAALGATIVALNQFARTRSIRTTADGGIQVFVDAVVRENDASGLLYPLAQSWRALRASYDDYLS